MPRFLKLSVACGITAFAMTATCLPPSRAGASGYGGGYGGESGSSIWSAAWWTGNPEGPGPYTGPPADAVDECIWNDVGGSVSDLAEALGEASLPESFFTAADGGGHPGIWGVLTWATELDTHAAQAAGDHFDLVACPDASEVPPSGGDVESDLPEAFPPDQPPMWVWVFFDTVADPAPSALPPSVGEAISELGLPAPTPSTSPDEIDGVSQATVVNLTTWLWIDSSIWHTYKAVATAGGVTATVWAMPSSVTWSASWSFPDASDDPEGGTTLSPENVSTTCDGPGSAYQPALGADQTTSCSAVFDESTLGTRQPLEATVSWVVHWAVSGPTGVVGGEGLLPTATTAKSLPLRVMQIESIIATG